MSEALSFAISICDATIADCVVWMTTLGVCER